MPLRKRRCRPYVTQQLPVTAWIRPLPGLGLQLLPPRMKWLT